MEFVSFSEYVTTLILIPLLSFAVFLIVSFIEILDKKNEFLFSKCHAHTKKDFVVGITAGLFTFVLFFCAVFVIDPYVDSLEPVILSDYISSDPVTWKEIITNLMQYLT